MARKEKFGRFVLLEEVETCGLGTEYRAAKLSPAGLEKIVSVLRLKPSLAAHPEAVKALMDQVKFAAQLHHANLLKIHGIGKVDAAYYVSHEFLEAKSLRAVFERTRRDVFPFSVDHTLLIASKACAALEHAHSRRLEGGARYFHGFITPSSVLVSYEGEVRLRGFGLWPSRIREVGGAAPDEEAYLSPEQAAGGPGDTRSDTWAVAALLYETLAGERFVQDGRREDVTARLAQARMKNPAGDDLLPRPIADILRKALAADPAARYVEVQEMRKAVDTLLFSGDFSPTTFNLAFFMHSLFRDDIEGEARALNEEREASYQEYVAEEPVRVPTVIAPPAEAPAAPAVPGPAAVASPPPPVLGREEAPARKPAAVVGTGTAVPIAAVPPPRPEPPVLGAHQAAAGLTFHRPPPLAPRTRFRLALVAMAALVLVGAAAGYVSLRGRPAPTAAAAEPPTTTLSAEAVAAMARVKELEERLRAIEAEKAAAEARAAEEARLKIEAQAAARGQRADVLSVARAQEEARRRAQAEEEQRLREEQARLEAEQRAAQERLAEERRREEEVRAAAAAAVVTTTSPPAPTPAPLPPVRAGALVRLSDPGVIAPVLDRAFAATYPPVALRQRLEGIVELNVLVDERGSVTETLVITGAGGRSGLNEAAVESVRRRKYRPAIKDGVPVKVWLPVRVQFRLPD
ncbi:MAG TPA: TonB family protein [Vicinamibacteria bacterium]|nr:TonB family protein [Vicinamibacteria bacterium]